MNVEHEFKRLIHLLEQIEQNTRPLSIFTDEDKTALDKLSARLEDLVKRFDKLATKNKRT